MSIADLLDERRQQLGLDVADVIAGMEKRGHLVASATAALWFNRDQATRWNPVLLISLLDVLRIDPRALVVGDLPPADRTDAIEAEAARYTPEQRQALLDLLRSFRT